MNNSENLFHSFHNLNNLDKISD